MTQANVLSASDRLRQQMNGGKVASVGAPLAATAESEPDEFLMGEFFDEQTPFGQSQTPAQPVATKPAAAPLVRPGHFTTEPIKEGKSSIEKSETSQSAALAFGVDAQGGDVLEESVSAANFAPAPASVLSAADRLRLTVNASDDARRAKREMASMKTLSRMLEAVFARPGSNATDQERMTALTTLAINARQLGVSVAKIAGDDAERSSYVCAMAMDAAVGMVCRSWEAGREVDWPTLVEASANTEVIMSTAVDLAQVDARKYEIIQTPSGAADRLAVSMHSAFWQLIELGDTVESLTPKLAAHIVRDCANYLQARDRFVADSSLYISWMQGSIGRMTNLICAEMRARFGDSGVIPTQEDIQAVLAVSRSGFEGVENYAQSILEISRPSHAPRADTQ